MAVVIHDEAAAPALYRLLWFLRLFLHQHPRVGAIHYAVHMGLGADLKTGWNAVEAAAGAQTPAKYIYISAQGGRTTETRPDVPDDQIHVSREDDIPEFEASPAQRKFMEVAQLVAAHQPPAVGADWLQEKLAFVNARAAAPLRGPDPAVDARIEQALRRIGKGVNTDEGSLPTFTAPAAEVIEDVLDFRLTTSQGSNILAVLIAYFAIKFPSPLDRSGGIDAAKQQIDHLINLTSGIIRDRHQYDLGSYGQLTQLGLLWGETAVLLATQLAKRSEGATLPQWLKRRALYAEETTIHELAPSLTHPISVAPLGLAEFQRAGMVGGLKTRGAYAYDDNDKQPPADPGEVWARMQSYSASRSRVAASYGAFQDFLSPALNEQLTTFLVTMKLGRTLK